MFSQLADKLFDDDLDELRVVRAKWCSNGGVELPEVERKFAGDEENNEGVVAGHRTLQQQFYKPATHPHVPVYGACAHNTHIWLWDTIVASLAPPDGRREGGSQKASGVTSYTRSIQKGAEHCFFKKKPPSKKTVLKTGSWGEGAFQTPTAIGPKAPGIWSLR